MTASGYTLCSVTTSFDLGSHIGPNEVVTSSTLIGRCTSAGCDPAHARQLARRSLARNAFWRSEKLTLRNNGRLFCHLNFRGSEGFVTQLLPILARERPGLHRLLLKLSADEVVLKPHAHPIPLQSRDLDHWNCGRRGEKRAQAALP